MSKSYGVPIWYELMTPDPNRAKAFYDQVIGWDIQPASSGLVDYRMIAAPGGHVGGVMQLSSDMQAGGAKPGWLFYVGVEDVDAAVHKAQIIGASVFVPPTDIPHVGRFALLADPQGAPFYIMRSASDADFAAFAPGVGGRCGWNELSTTDLKGALDFYGEMFGWENRETMNMAEMGGYRFLDQGSVRLGAMVEQADMPESWTFYFNVADVEAAAARVKAQGGAILMGPHPVPTGDHILVGQDPQGARFALVGPGTV